MNPSTMKELFKAEYGSSIAAHIRQHRMEKASALLLESGDSLAQVARAVGYESQSKFSAEFKKVFGYAALGVPEAPRRTLSRPACFRRECTCYLR